MCYISNFELIATQFKVTNQLKKSLYIRGRKSGYIRTSFLGGFYNE